MTANLPITRRQQFVHLYECGRRMILHVDKTSKEIRFRFEWGPALKNRRELEELHEEWNAWVSHWLGGPTGPKHSIEDFMFYQACQSQISQLIELLPP